MGRTSHRLHSSPAKSLRRVLIALHLCALLAARVFAQIPAVQVAINPEGPGRIFEGIGAASGGGAVSRLLINYPEPQRSQILDYLFKPNFGASLQMLKVEIGGDGNSTEGSEPSHMHTPTDENYDRGFEWWLMKEAKKRNPDIRLLALAWDFPGWLKEADSDSTADYLARFIEGAKREHGLTIDEIGLWNETHMPYDFVGKLRRALDARRLTTAIVADDSVNDWSIARAVASDPELKKNVSIVATHYPQLKTTAEARQVGKSIWSSEDGPWTDAWGSAGDQAGSYAEVLNQNYVRGRMTATLLWCAVSSYYDILDLPNAGLLRAETPWSGHYQVMSPLWIVAHTTQFAWPGWRYLDGASGLLPDGGSYVTLTDGKDFSLIAESISAMHPVQLQIALDRRFTRRPLWLWRTARNRYFERLGAVHPVSGRASFVVEPDAVYSLTTTTSQHKGTASPGLDKAFPFPYRDDFEEYRTGVTTPSFFIEQNGSYEVAPCKGGRAGQCLRQVVDTLPIVWDSGKPADVLGTASIIGDKRWNNYQVESDFYLEEPGYARVMGRVSRATLDGAILGYQLYLHSTGKWELRTSTKGGVLASGNFDSPLNTWHRAALAFHGSHITARLDGAQLADVVDDSYRAGLAGLGNGWNQGEYDNFEIKPLSGIPLLDPRAPSPSAGIPSAPVFNMPLSFDHRLRLTWSRVEGAVGYRIKYGIEKGVYPSLIDAGNATSFNLTSLDNDRAYSLVVTAYNAHGESKPSDPRTAKPEAPQPAPEHN